MENTLEVNLDKTKRLTETMHSARVRLWSAILFGTISMLIFLLMPIYVGMLASVGYSDAQLGVLASMDLAGITVASIAAVFWLKSVNWRVASLISIILLVMANMLCIDQHDYLTLLVLRFVAGFAGGIGVVIAYKIISQSDSPDRCTGLFVTVQVLVQSLGFFCSPLIVEVAGSNSLYYLVATLAIIALPLIGYFPNRYHADHSRRTMMDGKSHRGLVMALISMTLFFLGQGAIWAFSDRIGVSAGLDNKEIANALAMTAFASLFGALLSAWIDIRFGRTLPILIAIVIQVLALVLFSGQMSVFYYTLFLSIFAFSWNFGIAFQVGVAASMDQDGQFTALIPAFQGAGLALGPLVAGMVSNGGSYFNINMLAGFSLILYLVVIVPVARKC